VASDHCGPESAHRIFRVTATHQSRILIGPCPSGLVATTEIGPRPHLLCDRNGGGQCSFVSGGPGWSRC